MTAQAPAEQTNRLAGETSPYLLQHAHNPVDWYPWGDEAFARARAEDRPILLSVGYSACHWCHVMERESFENTEIAELMNRHFVCVKVDREERPDVDQVYMTAVQMLAGQGGWPMTVFLTPDGRPFYGGTYYPPEDRYGHPGFPRVLLAVAEAWVSKREEIEQQSGAMVEQMRRMSALVDAELPESPVTPELFDRAFGTLRRSYDARLGGFGGAPKFPQPMLLDFLLRYAHRTKNAEPRDMAAFTLERMAQGGLFDQLGGGFHRYSTDEYWLVPHFEKMLYDNAQLAQTCVRAWQATGDAFFRRVAEETLDYVRREMTAPTGGFYSAQDADSEGEEGRYFVWTPVEIEEALGKDDAALFMRYYDVTPRGNWEARSILNVSAPEETFARSIGAEPAAFAARLAEMRRKLLAVREQRVHPATDTKVLTAWNGMMLAAFAEAAAVLGRADYRQTAENNAEFVLRELYRDRRLARTGREVEVTDEAAAGRGGDVVKPRFKVADIAGFLSDYACYADGLLRLYEATFDRRWLDAARALTDTMLALFADPEGGPFYDTSADAEALVERPRELTDNAVPAGNSVAVDVLLRLAVLTGEEAYRARAAAILGRLAPLMEQHPQAFGRLLCAADRFVGPARELGIVGDPEEPATEALLRASRAHFEPNLLIAAAPPDDPRAADLPLLAGRPQRDGRPTAYLCESNACKRPTTDPGELARQLNDGD